MSCPLFADQIFEAFYSPIKDVVVLGETIEAHERIQVEQSLKYSKPGATKLWNTASLKEVDQWMVGEEYGECTYTPSFLFTSTALPVPQVPL